MEHDFGHQGAPGLTVHLDLISRLDQIDEIRNGTGIRVGAPQYAPRRGVFRGVTESFN